MKRARITELSLQYRHVLLDDIIPFWLEHGLDCEQTVASCTGSIGTVPSTTATKTSGFSVAAGCGSLPGCTMPLRAA